MAERRFEYTQSIDPLGSLKVDIPDGEWAAKIAFTGDAHLVADPDMSPGAVRVTVIVDPEDPVAMAAAENLQLGPDRLTVPDVALRPSSEETQSRFNPDSELLELSRAAVDTLPGFGSERIPVGLKIEVRVAPLTE